MVNAADAVFAAQDDLTGTYRPDIASLDEHGLKAEVWHTGGFCFALRVEVPEAEGYVLLTGDSDGSLPLDRSWVEKSGARWWVGSYTDDGEWSSEEEYGIAEVDPGDPCELADAVEESIDRLKGYRNISRVRL